MTQLTFVTSRICPFAHRAWITLKVLGVDFDRKDVSLKAKPEWFTELYSKAHGANPGSDGKVPLIQDGDFLLCESAVVAEYLAAKFGPSKSIDLFPQTPKERALSALFISQEIDKYTSGFYALLRAQTPEAQAEGKEKLLSAIASISAKLAENGGPFVLGDRLTLADIYFFPFVHRLLVLEHYRNFTVPNDAKYEAFHRFAEAMRNHPGVAATLAADDKDFFIEAYTGYANP